MKYCVNCVHAVIPEKEQLKYARCNFNNPVSMVTGETEPSEMLFCQVQRESSYNDKCGSAAKYYEEKTNV